MENNTKTYLVGKNIKTLVGSEIPENSLDISKSTTQLYHIIPSCAYIISNSDGTAAPQEFSFFLFKKQNDTIEDVTKNTKFSIRYTVNDTEGTFNLSSNKLKESEFPYKLSDITSFIVQAMHDGIIAATFNIACVGEKSSGGGGSTGEKGEDGLMIYALPSIVTFQSNENGIVPEDQLKDPSKDIQIQAYRGSVQQTVIITNIETTNAETEIDDIHKDTFRFKSVAPQEIEMPQEDESATATKKVISYTSGQAVVQLSVDKVSCSITVPFIVDNTVLYNDFYTRTAKEMKSYYGLYTAQSKVISDQSTEIKQSAKEITATAREIKQAGETIQTNWNTWKQTADKAIIDIGDKVTTINGDLTDVKNNVAEINADGLKGEMTKLTNAVNGVTENYNKIAANNQKFEMRIGQVEKSVGTDGKPVAKQIESYMENNAGSIVAGVFSKDGDKTAKESVMTLTNDTFKLKILKEGLMAAGIDIKYENETGAGSGFTKSAINLIANEVSTNGNLSAASIQTKTYKDDNQTIDVGQPVIKIEKGMLTGYSQLSRLNGGEQPNLRFGIDEVSKTLQFEYRRDDGTLVWTLGSSGLIQYITSGQLQRMKKFWVFDYQIGSFGSGEQGGFGKETYIDENKKYNCWYIPGTGGAQNEIAVAKSGENAQLHTCFQYVAPTIQGQIVQDDQHGLSLEQAKLYNYKWFYSCTDDYTSNNLFKWDLSKNNVELGEDKKAEWKCIVLGSVNDNNKFANVIIVEDGIKWDADVPKLSRNFKSANIGLTRKAGPAKEQPSGQDDYISIIPYIYSSSVNQYE